MAAPSSVMSPHCYLPPPNPLSHPPIFQSQLLQLHLQGGVLLHFCTAFLWQVLGLKRPQEYLPIWPLATSPLHVTNILLDRKQIYQTVKFSDESKVTLRHRLGWGTIPLTQMGKIPTIPSFRYMSATFNYQVLKVSVIKD